MLKDKCMYIYPYPFQVCEMYLTFCGIGITNAKLFELSAIEFNRNRVSGYSRFGWWLQAGLKTKCSQLKEIQFNKQISFLMLLATLASGRLKDHFSLVLQCRGNCRHLADKNVHHYIYTDHIYYFCYRSILL